MTLYILTLLSAIALSLCSGFFSIYGLTALFTGNQAAIVFMGCSLEIAKIVGTIWVHKNWSNPKFSTILKSYMLPALFVLMLITSMGVYGFLSYTHINDQHQQQDTSFQTSYLEDQIKQERGSIEEDKKQLELLNKGISLLYDNNKVSTALKERKKQDSERQLLTNSIDVSYTKIDELTKKLEPLKMEETKIKQKLGPIEFVAKLLFNDLEHNTEKAVRVMILLIIFVFDPFAIVLMIAANISFSDIKKHTPEKKLLTEPFEYNDEKQILNEYEPMVHTPDSKRTTQHFGRVVLND